MSLTKPKFSQKMTELNGELHTTPDANGGKYSFGPFELDPRQRLLTFEGRPEHLPPRTFDLLLYLLERNNEVVDKNVLMNDVWRDTFVEDANLTVHISRIRKLLQHDAANTATIQTFPKTGYRFVAPVEVLGNGNGVSGDEAGAGLTTQDSKSKETIPTRSSRRTVFLALSAVLIVATLLGVVYFRTPAAPIGSIAVLPIISSDSEPGSDIISDGITEGLIRGLSRIPDITVKARSSVMAYKGKTIDPQQAGKELMAETLVLGYLSRENGEAAIRLELVEAETGNVLWAERFVRSDNDLISLENEIVTRLVERVLPAGSVSKPAPVETASSEAHKEYLEGRYYWHRRTNADFKTAILHFQNAVEQDPHYALAYSGLSDTYRLLPAFGGARAEDVMPQARAAATRALELDPSLAEAHASQGELLVIDRDWAGGEHEFKKAIELNPSYASAHQWYAELLCSLGAFDEARSEIHRAMELDPLSRIMRNIDGRISLFAGRNDEALEIFNRNIVLDPTWGGDHDYLFHVYAEKGMYAEAVEAHITAFSLLKDLTPENEAALRNAFAEGGWTGFLEERLRQFRDPSRKVPAKPFSIAEMHARLGQKYEALEILEKIFREKGSGLVLLKYLPSLKSLHGDPRYESLIRRLNFPSNPAQRN